MTIRVEIAGKGKVAEFPDGTDPSIIDKVIKRDYFSKQESVPDANYTTDPRIIEQRRREFAAQEDNSTSGKILRGLDMVKNAITPDRKTVANLARPSLEGTGMIAGEALGVPFSPVTGGASIPTLGGLGYAAGKGVADLIEGKQDTTLSSIGQDIKTGAQYSMGGAIAGKAIIEPAIKGYQVVRGGLSDIAKRKAADLAATTSQLTEQEATNAAKAADLAKRTGAKFTPAQSTGKPSLAALEEQLATADPTFRGQLAAQDAASIAAGQNKVLSSIGKGKPLPVAPDMQITGKNIIKAVTSGRAEAKKIHEELYNAIPNTPMPTSKISDAINNLKSGFRVGDESVYPGRVISKVEEVIKPPKPIEPAPVNELDARLGNIQPQPAIQPPAQVGFQDLHSLRKDISRQIQDASTGINPNRELAAKLSIIKNSIDDTIESVMGKDNQYIAAKDAFIDFANKYRKGSVGKMLRSGKELSGLAVTDENIARQLFTPSGSQGLIKAVGQKTATDQMRPFVIADMIKSTAKDGVTMDVQAAINYIQRNRPALERLGLVKDAQQLIKDQFPKQIENMISKRASDPTTGAQFLTAQEVRTILSKQGSAIKQMFGNEALTAFRDYNAIMGNISRKNIIPRGGNSNTNDKAVSFASSMISKSTGPAKKLTDGLLMGIAKGAGLLGGGGAITGHLSPVTLAAGGGMGAVYKLAENAQGIVAQNYAKILQEATLNPAIAKDLMTLSRTGKMPATLQTIINKNLLGASTVGVVQQ